MKWVVENWQLCVGIFLALCAITTIILIAAFSNSGEDIDVHNGKSLREMNEYGQYPEEIRQFENQALLKKQAESRERRKRRQ
jgi:hypothetical protein